MSEAPKPSVGRVVHFYSEAVAMKDNCAGRGFNGVGAGPYLAHVTQVFEDADGNTTYANLYVIPPVGDPFHKGLVPMKGSSFYEDGDFYWEWPPRA
ncbi:hypothetical protein [Parvibaculum sp.]|uniref:hypothetical protein n=1 Tax=Parvibaculum sp. TaxID=2024848 RepID=UPI002736D949|nr:hypothetical protein [Parvibaculum sp.]MDP3327176.1 hypothetical protein [Parvibaculum sp.]